MASQNLLPSKLKAGTVSIPRAVDNRLIKNGPEDPLFRVIQIERSDSSKLLLTNYTAHATCLYSTDLRLSRDYPGELVDNLEKSGYDFAMFMAGAVGSHRCNPPEYGDECIDWMATHITEEFNKSVRSLKPISDATLRMVCVPLALMEPQVKISENWKVRSWLFRAAFKEYPAYLTALRIGDLVMLGTPCDFSGEFDAVLDSLAKDQGLAVMVTSFNGGYIGYVTPEKYYDVDHNETQLMNWYPPGNGEYIVACLHKLLLAVKSNP
jgi:hypothetical protein